MINLKFSKIYSFACGITTLRKERLQIRGHGNSMVVSVMNLMSLRI